MTDYKHTLNLPQTAFPMKANLTQREPERLLKWDASNLYQRIRSSNKGKPKFVLHDGPPYANGELHVGHAVNKVLKDIIVKSKTLSGFDAPYVPGWDCHGLPIELHVEKRYGKAGQKLTSSEFRQHCRDYASRQVSQQRIDFMRMGVLGDWQNPYLTMDFDFEANTVRTLGKIMERGHLKQGFKPVHWCLDCASALAEAEVEYTNKTSSAIDVIFPFYNHEEASMKLGVNETIPLGVAIWTTTPWTLAANRAVCLSPSLNYVVLRVGRWGLLVAEMLVESCAKRFDLDSIDVLGGGLGADLDCVGLIPPFDDTVVPIVLGEHVTTETGTGCVHTAPAHGLEDFEVGRRYNLEVYNPVAVNGVYLAGTPVFAGQHIFKSNDAIIDELSAREKLLSHQLFEHSYPHCWRHKTPLIFRATPQWFVAMQDGELLKNAKVAAESVSWVPDWGRARIDSMLESRPDWCISRQRSWGVPIPLFVNKGDKSLHPASKTLLERVANLIEVGGIDAWFDLDIQDLLGNEAKHYEKVTDTLDVWFDSGVTHACVLRGREELNSPADLYLEGSDQHRGWFQSSLLTSVGAYHHAPYRQVLTHGFTVDGEGRKMSKSLGNIISVKKAVNELGADVLRLWVASADYRSEIAASKEIFKRAADSYRRIRNTARFLLANLAGFEPSCDLLVKSDLLPLDAWIINRARHLQSELRDAYDSFQFHLVYHKIHNFCGSELGGFYLDIIKDRQYTTQVDSRARRSAQTALFHLSEALCRWIAPILSFTAEEIWENLPGKREESIFLTEWYVLENMTDLVDESLWSCCQSVRHEVNKAIEIRRAAGEMRGSLDAVITLYVSSVLHDALEILGDELRFVLITSEAHLRPFDEAPADAHRSEMAGLKIVVALSASGKCERCWHRCPDVGEVPAHPTLCQRCITNIDGLGEFRRYA